VSESLGTRGAGHDGGLGRFDWGVLVLQGYLFEGGLSEVEFVFEVVRGLLNLREHVLIVPQLAGLL